MIFNSIVDVNYKFDLEVCAIDLIRFMLRSAELR